MFCAPQEAAPVCNYQCAFPKCAADAAIGVNSEGCTPLHLTVRADGDGVIERVRTLLQAAPDAALITNARGRTPLHSAVFWFSTAAVLREILHIRPACVSIRAGSGAWGEGGAGGQGQTALELLCEVHDCGCKYDFWEMAALIVRASVYGTTVGVDLVSVDGKVDQEPSRDLAHAAHATLRLYGCLWEAIRLGFQQHPHELWERDVNGDLTLHTACTSAPYFSERDNENNAPNVIESLLSLHGAATTVPNRNGKMLIGLLIASGTI